MIRKPIMNALVLSILANQVLRTFGEMTIVRGEESSGWRKLVCISDDDGGALVWNSNLVWKYDQYKFKDRKDNMQFYEATPFRSVVHCSMRANDNCLSKWNTNLWSLTNSRITPMGPVFDQRWEEFKEYESFSDKYNDADLVNATAALSFSVRAASDVHILLCNGNQYLKNTCYWIIIGGWLNKKSVIRKCVNGVPEAGNFPPSKSSCAMERVSFTHSPISAVNWQSFVITWDSVTRNISVYDTDKVIMTYVDEEKSEDLNFDYHVFIRSSNPMLFRFHIYDFLRTTTEGATLTSPDFVFNKEICVQLLVGLCAECSADVMLRDTKNGNVLESMSVEGSSTAYNLPTWQSVKIEKSLSTIDYTYVTIQIIPRLKSQNLNPLWAIADVRQCPPSGSLRIGLMTAKSDWINYNSGYYWPVVTCQKLFYKENTFVNSASIAKLNMELNDTVCWEDFIGPQCLVSCSQRLESNSCTGTSICYKGGCKCSPGFYGTQCSYNCNWGTYGYNCEKTCGACAALDSCNRATGMCPTGCQYDKTKLYIPPSCRTGIDKPNMPAITALTKTSIQAVVSMMWKDEYEKTGIFYSFSIQKRGGVRYQQAWNRVFRNMTQLIGYFENLQSATIYEIVCSLSIGASNEQKIDSDQKSVETTCDTTKEFEVTLEETVLKIDLRKSADQIHPCPADWYRLEIWNTSGNALIIDESQLIAQFPYKSPRLLPYTTYKVTISSKYDEVLFSREVRTPEGTPSKVLHLQATLMSNTRVILSWEAPEQPNGIIKQYDIILKVDEYSGCKDLGLSSPNNHTTQRSTKDTWITITQLHPYARYSAQVLARNSRHDSESAKMNFTTTKTEIPAATFSRFKMQDWKLSWSPPEDCTTILGPIYARVKIRGVSDAVRNFVKIITTAGGFFVINFLYGGEQYVATIYAVRDYSSVENSSAYQEIEFKTPPKAPPGITNLDVVEVDTRRNEIHLRWQNPNPPFNGKLQKYIIYSCTASNRNCKPINVKLDEYCDLWDNFICKVIPKSSNIRVVVTNENVSDPSLPAYVTPNMLKNTMPTAPRNYTATIKDNGVVDLRWLHPWKTGNRLKYFHIKVEEISSRRRTSRSLKIETYEYTVTSYMREYSKRLYLLPFTSYEIFIQSVTIAGQQSSIESERIQTPSTIDFHGDLKLTAQEYDTTVLLEIPPVLNDTSDSMLHIIIKGPNPCEQYTQVPADLSTQVGLSAYDVAWQAAVVSTPKLEGKMFTVGDNEIYGNGTNCLLKSGVLYEITVAVTGRNVSDALIVLTRSASIRIGEAPPRHHEAWFIPFVILFAVTGVALYFYRRRKQESIKRLMLQDEVILSPNVKCYEHENMKAVISNSKQGLSTPSDRQSLSRATTPEVPPIAIENDDEQEEVSSLVKVKDFEDYVRQAIQSKLLDKQYETFPRGQTQPWDYGKLPQNKTKNRYGNLIAYDETRVVLTKLPDDDYSDYINANYITGYKQEKRYIATQGPKPNTVVDFWRMIWQEKVLIICMLANMVENGKTKCEQYWPDIGKKKKYGDVIVLNAKHNVFADYCFRTFHVTCKEETRKVEHLHYTAWPDHGVPLYTHSVVTYLKKLLATPPGNGPVVVHCSAGVGRTGTIVLCDICLHRAAAEGVVDVFAETASIRRERANMVDNKQQYLLAHLALVECLLSIPTTLPCNETLPVRIKEMKKKLSVQQQRLQNTAWQDEALRQVAPTLSLSERNRAKNRFPELILDKISRIYLKRYPASDEDSDYLSAVYVDGVKLQNQYLAMQLPMPSTINDFWRMIAEFKVELILMLQPPDSADSTCCAIAPASGEFKPTPYLNVAVKEIVELETHTSQKLLLVDNSEKPSREQSVTILCMKEWKPGRNQPPPSVISMVTFWQAAERVSRGDGPTVTMCHDGVIGCGLYLALGFLLERMAVERECDVCLAVRAVRRSRPDFVRSLEHLEYLYDAAIAYLEYFETYANFS